MRKPSSTLAKIREICGRGRSW